MIESNTKVGKQCSDDMLQKKQRKFLQPLWHNIYRLYLLCRLDLDIFWKKCKHQINCYCTIIGQLLHDGSPFLFDGTLVGSSAVKVNIGKRCHHFRLDLILPLLPETWFLPPVSHFYIQHLWMIPATNATLRSAFLKPPVSHFYASVYAMMSWQALIGTQGGLWK